MEARSRNLAGLVATAVLAVACSSAGLPGAKEPLEAIDEARRAQIDVALSGAARAEEAHRAQFDTYTSDITVLMQQGVRPGEGITLTIAFADATAFCIEARHSSVDAVFHVTNTNPVSAEGPC